MLATILALALAQQPQAAQLPDPALLDALVRTTNALAAFSAEYRTRVAGQDARATIQILYRAPDATKIVLGDQSIFRIQKGFLDARVFQGVEKPLTAHLPIAELILARFHRLAAVMRAEFPACADAWSDAADPGIRFDLSIHATTNAAEKSLQFTASYACPSPVRFGWLRELAGKPCTPAEDDRLVFEDPFDAGGLRFTLSTKTGFLEEVESVQAGATSSFALAALDLSPQIDDAAFDLPLPAADAIDASAFFAERIQQVQTQKHRQDVLASVAKLVAGKRIEWDPASRAHLARVLETIHAEGWTLENEIWIAEMRRRMGEFAAWLRDRLRDPALADAKSRERLDQAVAEWRQSLPLSAGSALDQRRADLPIDDGVTADGTLRQAFLEIEREAVKKTLGSALVEPLLREFDEKIAEVRKAP